MQSKISWKQFEKNIGCLLEMMKDFKPDVVVPSMRGGLVPAVLLAEKLGLKDIRPINIDRVGKERKISYDVRGEVTGSRLLLLEDDLPTGKGFVFAKEFYEKKGAIVKSASVHVNSTSKQIVDFYGKEFNPLPGLPWKPSRSCDRVV